MDRDPDPRQAFPVAEGGLQPVGPGHDPALTTSFDPTRLDFGHHAGSSIEELARIDPEYLHWLVRHPSGSRYRAEIQRVLGMVPSATDWNR